MARSREKAAPKANGANLGFEAKLWLTADKLRNNMDAAEYKGTGKYKDVAGFCKSATTEEIAGHGHVLTPGRYVGAEEVEDDGEPFAEKMARLVAELSGQFAEGAKLEKAIKANLKGLGHGG